MSKLVFASAVLVFSSLANAAVSYEVLKNADGGVLTATREAAQAACSERQAHLATAREFAQIAQERGANGIREARRPGQSAVAGFTSDDLQGPNREAYMNSIAGFDQVVTRDESRKVIDFYYSRQNFKCWAGDLDHDFWTASDVGPGDTYVFLGKETNWPGALRLTAVDENTVNAVLCVR